MILLAIEPSFLICPKTALSAADANFFIEKLLSLFELINSENSNEWIESVITADMADILESNGEYPHFETIRNLIRSAGDNSIQIKDILSVIDSILNTSKKLEFATGLFMGDVQISNRGQVGNGIIGNITEDFLALTMIYTRKSGKENNNFAIGGFQSYGVILNEDLLFPEADIYEEIHSIDVSNIKSNLRLLESTKNLPRFVNSAALAVYGKKSSAVFERSLKFMIDGSVLRGEASHTLLTTERRWYLGREFFHDVISIDGTNNESNALKILRSCSEVFLEINLNKVHALREGSGANDKQATCCGMHAWRRDIDDEFHMHYWREEETFEFSSVGVHNDFRIAKCIKDFPK